MVSKTTQMSPSPTREKPNIPKTSSNSSSNANVEEKINDTKNVNNENNGKGNQRRPSTLSVNPGRKSSSAATASSPTGKSSPTGGTGKLPTSPGTGKAPTIRRTSSLKSPGMVTKTTSPQAPRLATEARSLIRPCGCSHGHGTKGHQHHAPTPQKEPPKEKPKSKVSRPSIGSDRKASITGNKGKTFDVSAPLTSLRGPNRFITTLVWVPTVYPRKLSTPVLSC